MLELLSNCNEKNHRRIFHETLKLLELLSNRGKWNEFDRSRGRKES